jgi:uncharacterized SAM-binding protein YcdF (DUF218 family)
MSTAPRKKRPHGGFGAAAIALHAARVTVILCLAAALGFFVFAYSVSVTPSRDPQAADGIVALTGDEDRISEAVRLLSEGKARRLLISGVNKSTRALEIISLNTAGGKEAELFRCCVDLDKRAHNTEDNAVQTTAWVRSQGFHSLIVVTSTYHMPRTLIELRQAMPDIELVPYPVKAPRLEEQWWSHARTAWVLAKEYLKFITASLRYGAKLVLGGAVKAEHRTPVINARVN